MVFVPSYIQIWRFFLHWITQDHESVIRKMYYDFTTLHTTQQRVNQQFYCEIELLPMVHIVRDLFIALWLLDNAYCMAAATQQRHPVKCFQFDGTAGLGIKFCVHIISTVKRNNLEINENTSKKSKKLWLFCIESVDWFTWIKENRMFFIICAIHFIRIVADNHNFINDLSIWS